VNAAKAPYVKEVVPHVVPDFGDDWRLGLGIIPIILELPFIQQIRKVADPLRLDLLAFGNCPVCGANRR
jgi:hypothetical protein